MMKLKVLTAAVALACSGSALALTGPTDLTTGSSLWLTVWKGSGSTATTYARELTAVSGNGGTLSGMTNYPGAAPATIDSSWTSNSGFTYTNAGDTLFDTLFNAGDTVAWTIHAGALNAPSQNVSTFSVVDPAGAALLDSFTMSQIETKMDGYVGQLNTLGCNLNPSCNGTGNGAFFGGNATSWGTKIAGTLPGTFNQRINDTLAAGGGTDAAFWLYAENQLVRFKNDQFDGYWELFADGQVKYTLQAVPEPSTWAMLGAGLLALLGVARRRTSA
jgi:hypothetical protein